MEDCGFLPISVHEPNSSETIIEFTFSVCERAWLVSSVSLEVILPEHH